MNGSCGSFEQLDGFLIKFCLIDTAYYAAPSEIPQTFADGFGAVLLGKSTERGTPHRKTRRRFDCKRDSGDSRQGGGGWRTPAKEATRHPNQIDPDPNFWPSFFGHIVVREKCLSLHPGKIATPLLRRHRLADLEKVAQATLEGQQGLVNIEGQWASPHTAGMPTSKVGYARAVSHAQSLRAEKATAAARRRFEEQRERQEHMNDQVQSSATRTAAPTPTTTKLSMNEQQSELVADMAKYRGTYTAIPWVPSAQSQRLFDPASENCVDGNGKTVPSDAGCQQQREAAKRMREKVAQELGFDK